MKNIIKTGLIICCFLGTAQATIVSSTFDSDNEGWKIAGDSTSASSTYNISGGNLGGFISAVDSVAGGVWYFDAPTKFLGNKVGVYGEFLSFDLKQTGSGSQFNSKDIILNGGGMEISYDAMSNPVPVGEWVSYSIKIDDLSGWLVGGIAATEADMLTVLTSLDRLRIRGEFISGSDTGRLDNVAINVVPIPAALWMMGLGVMGLLSFRKKTNQV